MRNEDKPYWELYDRSTTIAENQDESVVEGSINLLEQVLLEIENPYVDINICDKTKKEIGRGGNKQRYNKFTINLGHSSKEVAKSTGLSKVERDLIEKNFELQRKIDRLEDQKKYDELLRKIDDIKNNDVLSKLLSSPQVMQGIGSLLGVKPGTTMGIASAGVEDETIPASAVERQQKIKAAIVRLARIDSRFDDTITMLADFAEKNPEQYFESIKVMQTMI